MLKFIFSLFFIVFSASVFAQNNKEVEVYVNGELEKIPLSKKNIFITAQGDTIEYLVDDILKEMMKNQPVEKDSTDLADKKNDKKIETVINQEKVEEKLTDKKVEAPNIEVQQREMLEREKKLADEKLVAEKAARENAHKQNEILKQKMIEEQQMKQSIEKAKADSMVETQKPIELKYKQWVDSLEQAEAKGEKLKTISGKVTYSRELYPEGYVEAQVVNEIIKDTIKAEPNENKELLTVKEIAITPAIEEEKVVEKQTVNSVINKSEEKDSVVTVINKVEEPVVIAVKKEPLTLVVKNAEEPAKIAEPIIEIEEKKAPEIQKMNFELKKYFLPDPLVTADNIGLMDTLKFINTGASGNSAFPSMELGSANNFSLCYDYTVCNYHGYDEETIARETTRYKVCLSGIMNDKNKVAEVYVDTKTGRKKIYYSVALHDDENLILIKR
jgi:hypothetical protein